MSTFFNFKLELEPNIIDMIYDLLRMSTMRVLMHPVCGAM